MGEEVAPPPASLTHAVHCAVQILFYMMVFITLDPVKAQLWMCTDPADRACSTAWGLPDATSFCELDRSQWRWTTTGQQQPA